MATMFEDLMAGLDEVDAFLAENSEGCKINLAPEPKSMAIELPQAVRRPASSSSET